MTLIRTFATLLPNLLILGKLGSAFLCRLPAALTAFDSRLSRGRSQQALSSRTVSCCGNLMFMISNRLNALPLIASSLLLMVLLPIHAFANDALVEVHGGAAHLLGTSHPTIRMTAETVRIELGPDGYVVDASFQFFNSGPATRLTVGFPRRGFGYTSEFKGVKPFDHFAAWVNGRGVSFTEVPGEVFLDGKGADRGILAGLNEPDEKMESRSLEDTWWYVRAITFPGKRALTTRVRYGAPYDRFNSVHYLYGTGRTWSGSIGKARFIIRASPQAWAHKAIFIRDGLYKNIRRFTVTRLTEYEHEYVLTDIKPSATETLILFVSSREQPWEDCGEAFVYDDKPLPEDLLKKLSLWQLELLRNSFLAVHGKAFDLPELDKFFRGKAWYHPSSSYQEGMLRRQERANYQKVRRYEEALRKRLGGKESDRWVPDREKGAPGRNVEC